MKIWTKVHIKKYDKSIYNISKSFINYLYSTGPITDITSKYNISIEDRKKLEQYTANRIAGLLMLYLAKDVKRINDIANKYNIDNSKIEDILPEIEGYIDK